MRRRVAERGGRRAAIVASPAVPVAAWPAAVLAAAALAACCSSPTVGSGELVTRSFPLEGFVVVEAAGGFEVDCAQAAADRVSLTADDNLIGSVRVVLSGQTLAFSLPPGARYEGATLRASVALRTPKKLVLSGGARAAVRFDAARYLDFVLSGGSSVRGHISALTANVVASAGSEVVLSGELEAVTVSASGGSSADLSDLQTSRAEARLGGGSRATVRVVGPLDADLRGGSTLTTLGRPVFGRVTTTGGSTIKRK